MENLTPLLSKNVEQIFPSEEALKKALGGRKLRVYLGVDPSSPEIHLGHTILLKKLRQFQDLGHEVILLIGDFTGMIGDPTGKDKTRVPLTREQVRENAETYKEQASKIIDFNGRNPAKIMYNSSWLDKLKFREIIDLASNFTVQQLLERDMFQERLKAGKPISLHEFLYPLMQGYDSAEMKVDVEIGGTDQTFNMLIGRELVKNLLGKEKYVLTTPLLLGLNGEKMSKSAANTIPITASADDMYGKIMSLRDELIFDYFKMLTDISREELSSLEKQLKNREVNPRDVKAKLAKSIVSGFYSEKKAEEAESEFIKVFKKGEQPSQIQRTTKTLPAGSQLTMVELIRSVNMAPSNSAASRLIEQGAVEVDGIVRKHPLERIEIKNKITKIRVGKRGFLEIDWRKNETS